jgi:hypothetical protein
MSHGRAWILGLLAVAGTIAFVPSADASGEARYLDAGERPFDPVVAALEVAEDDIADLRHAQDVFYERLAASDDLRSPTAVHLIDLDGRWEDAIDDLYSAVADTPEAAILQEEWRECMARAGTPFQSPMDMQDAIDIAYDESILDVSDGYGASVADEYQAVIDNSVACEIEGQGELDQLVALEFPDWSDVNADLIDEYRTELGL